MHCTARLTACPFCMRGREEALASLQLSMAAPRWPALQEGGRRPGNRVQGGLGAWPPSASRAGHCRRAGARGDWGRRRCRATCRHEAEGAMQEVAMT